MLLVPGDAAPVRDGSSADAAWSLPCPPRARRRKAPPRRHPPRAVRAGQRLDRKGHTETQRSTEDEKYVLVAFPYRCEEISENLVHTIISLKTFGVKLSSMTIARS